MIWDLPRDVEINGSTFNIRTDYRDILKIIKELNNPDKEPWYNIRMAFAMFYEDYEAIKDCDYERAVEEMLKFINCGELEEGNENEKPPQRIDWEQDGLLIVSDINKVIHDDVRALEYMHWWSFIAAFSGIGEGQLSAVVSLREKKRKGEKLTKSEEEFYRENKSRVDLERHYSAEEQAERNRINRMLNGEF